jgi:hypothetical protein
MSSSPASSHPAHLVDSAVDDAVGSVGRRVVPTDEADAGLARARHVALELARKWDAEVVLYDRSAERWTDTPHPSGPSPLDKIDPARRPHLDQQMRQFIDAGLRVTAYLATVPALTAILDVLQELDVDAIVLPDALESPTVMDRLQVGSDPVEMVGRIAGLQLDRTAPAVLAVDSDGRVRLVRPEMVRHAI